MARDDELVEVEAEFVTQTDAAICIDVGGTEDVWLPKSLIEFDADDCNVGEPITIMVPEWKAIEANLV